MRKRKEFLSTHCRALFFCTEHRIEKICIAAHLGKRIFGSRLMTFLFGESLTFTSWNTFNNHCCVERRTRAVRIVSATIYEIEVNAILLFPFQQFTFEIHLLVSHGVEVKYSTDDAFFYELKSISETTVKINGTHQRLKTISFEVWVVRASVCLTLYQAVDAKFFRQFSERLTWHYFRACVGEKSFAFVGILTINNVTHHSFQHGIAEKFQTFVVERLVTRLFRAIFVRFMGKSCAIQVNVVRTEAHDLVESGAELLVFAEKESSSVEYIFHT